MATGARGLAIARLSTIKSRLRPSRWRQLDCLAAPGNARPRRGESGTTTGISAKGGPSRCGGSRCLLVIGINFGSITSYVRAKRFLTPDTFPQITRWQLEQGLFKLATDGNRQPNIVEQASKFNFYPGLLLFEELQHEHQPAEAGA